MSEIFTETKYNAIEENIKAYKEAFAPIEEVLKSFKNTSASLYIKDEKPPETISSKNIGSKSIYRINNYLATNEVNLYDATQERVSQHDFDEWDKTYFSFIQEKINKEVEIIDFKETIKNLNELRVDSLLISKIESINNDFIEDDERMIIQYRSLLSALRFHPLLSAYSESTDIYLSDDGELCATVQDHRKTLNLTFKNNDEVVFSYFDSTESTVKITGSSSFSNILKNSRKIKKLFNFLED